MPTYNRGYIISRAITSVLAQTFPDFELIIIDDGSTDDTKEVVSRFDDNRIKYIRHEKNRGYCVALNTGVKASRGEYIAFLDSDDEYLPSKIDEQLAVFKQADSDVGAVYSETIDVNGDKRKYLHDKLALEGDIYKYVLNFYPIYLQALIVRREFIDRVGMFDEGFTNAGDFDFCIRLSKITKFKYVKNPLVVRYVMSDSMSVSNPAVIKGLECILSKHVDEIRKDRRILAAHYARLGSYICLVEGINIAKGRMYYIKAFKTYPFDAKSIMGLAASIPGRAFYRWTVESYHKLKKSD